MSDEQTYKLTTHRSPGAGPDKVNVEPPAVGYVPHRVLSPRTDQVTILWRPASAARVEIEGESLHTLEELAGLLEAAATPDRDVSWTDRRVEKGDDQ